MKGTVSKELEEILKDPKGREMLKARLLDRKDGAVVVGNKSYDLQFDVRREPKKSDRRG